MEKTAQLDSWQPARNPAPANFRTSLCFSVGPPPPLRLSCHPLITSGSSLSSSLSLYTLTGLTGEETAIPSLTSQPPPHPSSMSLSQVTVGKRTLLDFPTYEEISPRPCTLSGTPPPRTRVSTCGA
ncbi:unnamed protein product [Pleuronectes platessa]|uniref:Uncharacterized protein n=1 Tax=Pleuronectes platessa TaxID=8262 RepID=A0A9N7UAG7_PLEPL|nr:unnamed protein product [Pleuronectes platessa]